MSDSPDRYYKIKRLKELISERDLAKKDLEISEKVREEIWKKKEYTSHINLSNPNE